MTATFPTSTRDNLHPVQPETRRDRVIAPQVGPQAAFLATPADIAGYGGAAGGGKTWALLAEPLRHVENPAFGFVIFRKTYPQIMNEGGLWDKSMELYPIIGAKPRLSDTSWDFPWGSSGKFSHLQYDTNVLDWQGAEIPYIAFDELTHFSEYQFFYLLSRNRSLCGVQPYVRATMNPDASSWARKFFAPWVDKRFVRPALSGEIRYFIRVEGEIIWLSDEDAIENDDAKSVTFIHSRITDNKILLAKDPGYLRNLKALPLVERMRLLDGDWDILPAAGKIFQRDWIPVLPRRIRPKVGSDDQIHELRFWDLAATIVKQKGDDPDWTAGVKLRRVGDRIQVVDVKHVRCTPGELDGIMARTAKQDEEETENRRRVPQRWEIEGGAAGKIVNRHFINVLKGYDARGVRPRGDKVTRASPFASQCEAGNVSMLQADWNEKALTEMHHFPDWSHDDIVDACSGAYTEIEVTGTGVRYSRSIYD